MNWDASKYISNEIYNLNFKLNPKTLLVIDGLGALLSAFSLGVVLTKYELIFGMPRKTLYLLTTFPCLFAIYDFVSIKINAGNLKRTLRTIAFANLAYCCLSIFLIYQHYAQLTIWGLAYFLIEIIVLIGLVITELKTAYK